MLEAVGALCAEHGAPAQLALEAGMACGFGACFGCVVPTRDGYVRLCVEGPVFDAAVLATWPNIGAVSVLTKSGDVRPGARRSRAVSGERLLRDRAAHPMINASGTLRRDRRAAGVRRGAARRFPFAAFVSKTITLGRAQGNPPPRLWELAGGMINSIGLPNKGLERFLGDDLPLLARAARAADHERDGVQPRTSSRELVEALGAQPAVAALELNVSCPNVETGLDIGADPRELEALLARAAR